MLRLCWTVPFISSFFSVPSKFIADFNGPCLLYSKLDNRPEEKSLYLFVPSLVFSPFQRYTRFSWTCENRSGIAPGVLVRKRRLADILGGFTKSWNRRANANRHVGATETDENRLGQSNGFHPNR